MNDQFREELQSMKKYQTEIQKIKNSIVSMSYRSDPCEDKVSELEDKLESGEHIYSEIP